MTRPERSSSVTAEALRRLGAEPIELPLITLGPPPDPGLVANTILRLADFDVIVFSSANAVTFFLDQVDALGAGVRVFAGARLAAIGQGTAQALEARGLRADIIPAAYVGEALAEAILQDPVVQALPRPRILLLRALAGREVVARTLERAGCLVTLVPVYQTRPAQAERREDLRSLLRDHPVDWVILTSSSAVDSLVDLIGTDLCERFPALRIASIGPITTATALCRGLRVDVTAPDHTLDGVIQAMARTSET